MILRWVRGVITRKSPFADHVRIVLECESR